VDERVDWEEQKALKNPDKALINIRRDRSNPTKVWRVEFQTVDTVFSPKPPSSLSVTNWGMRIARRTRRNNKPNPGPTAIPE